MKIIENSDDEPGGGRVDPAVITRKNSSHQKPANAEKLTPRGDGLLSARQQPQRRRACAARQKARPALLSDFERSLQLNDEHRGPYHLGEKERLGHGRGSHVEQTGVEAIKSGGHGGAGKRQPKAGQPIHAGTTQDVAGERNPGARQPGAPPIVVLHKRHEQKVGQGQPDRPKLVEARIHRIDNTPRNVEVRDRIAVEKKQSVTKAIADRASRPATSAAHAAIKVSPAIVIGSDLVSVKV